MASTPSTRSESGRSSLSGVPDPLSDHANIAAALDLAAKEAKAYLAGIDDALVRPRTNDVVREMDLPDEGIGSLGALGELVEAADKGSTRSAGPRFFHFVMGGDTPAALGADWLTSTLDQNAYNWVSSPLAARIEQIAIDWLKGMFGIAAGCTSTAPSGSSRRSARRRGTWSTESTPPIR